MSPIRYARAHRPIGSEEFLLRICSSCPAQAGILLGAVYAFMRRCDDIADDNNPQASTERRNKLANVGSTSVHRALAGTIHGRSLLLLGSS